MCFRIWCNNVCIFSVYLRSFSRLQMILPTAHSSSLIQPSAQQPPSSPRGRKRQMEANDSFTHLQKRHSHSDVSDDDFGSHKSHSPSLDDDRRAHHNELERRRRDHIKDHFHSLKEVIPLLDGEKSSRALILKRAVEYISHMQSTLNKNQVTIEELQKRNQELSSESWFFKLFAFSNFFFFRTLIFIIYIWNIICMITKIFQLIFIFSIGEREESHSDVHSKTCFGRPRSDSDEQCSNHICRTPLLVLSSHRWVKHFLCILLNSFGVFKK